MRLRTVHRGRRGGVQDPASRNASGGPNRCSDQVRGRSGREGCRGGRRQRRAGLPPFRTGVGPGAARIVPEGPGGGRGRGHGRRLERRSGRGRVGVGLPRRAGRGGGPAERGDPVRAGRPVRPPAGRDRRLAEGGGGQQKGQRTDQGGRHQPRPGQVDERPVRRGPPGADGRAARNPPAAPAARHPVGQHHPHRPGRQGVHHPDRAVGPGGGLEGQGHRGCRVDRRGGIDRRGRPGRRARGNGIVRGDRDQISRGDGGPGPPRVPVGRPAGRWDWTALPVRQVLRWQGVREHGPARRGRHRRAAVPAARAPPPRPGRGGRGELPPHGRVGHRAGHGRHDGHHHQVRRGGEGEGGGGGIAHAAAGAGASAVDARPCRGLRPEHLVLYRGSGRAVSVRWTPPEVGHRAHQGGHLVRLASLLVHLLDRFQGRGRWNEEQGRWCHCERNEWSARIASVETERRGNRE
mmetsp:Transcript_13651/g.32438  ORF Transcript_13651/g.32438 Transcript_13651/m.32438 type:complete len:463 (+) Transcript_13651:218-1606(+)